MSVLNRAPSSLKGDFIMYRYVRKKIPEYCLQYLQSYSLLRLGCEFVVAIFLFFCLFQGPHSALVINSKHGYLGLSAASVDYAEFQGYLTNYIRLKNPQLEPRIRQHLLRAILTKADTLKLLPSYTILGKPVHPVFFLTAIIEVESSFNPYAVSPVGARGYMQIMPPTLTWLDKYMGMEVTPTHRLFETEVNLDRGIAYFNYLTGKMQNLRLVCLAYNAGPGNIQRGYWKEEYWQRIVNTYLRLHRVAKEQEQANLKKRPKTDIKST